MAGHHSIHSHATEDGKVLSSKSDSSQDEGDGAEEEDNTEEDKGRVKTSSDGQEVSDGEDRQEPLIPRTPLPVLVSSSVNMRPQTQSQTPD